MSVLAIILIVLVVLVVLVFVGGLVAARRRARRDAPEYARHLAEADHALEQARASDRGWDRAVMEEVARRALERERPGVRFDRLDLVLVDDRPGVVEDRAHFEASDGNERVPVILSRGEAGWTAERVG
jgi:cbb3-type cytochrome oxidase subunit 3